MQGTIDERVLKLKPKSKDGMYLWNSHSLDILENHNVFINSAIAIGCPGMQKMSQELFQGNVNQIVNSCYEIVKVEDYDDHDVIVCVDRIIFNDQCWIL